MTHFPDLSPLYYHSGPLDSDEWNCPLLAIGWLDSEFTFQTGGTPKGLAAHIESLRNASWDSFPQYVFRGLHGCTLCNDGTYLSESCVKLFIPGDHKVYVAPGRIDHYIDHHNYQPPEEFLQTLVMCPDPKSPEYWAALKSSNGDDAIPLLMD